MSFLTAQKKFRAIKKALTEVKFFVFTSKQKGPIMKINQNRGRFASVVAIVMIALFLVACGGGEMETPKAAQPLMQALAQAKSVSMVSAPLAAAKPLAQATDPLITDGERLLDLVEAGYNTLFPPGTTTTFDYLGVARVRIYSTGWADAYMTQDAGGYKRGDALVQGPPGSGSWEVINNVGSMYNFITPSAPTYAAINLAVRTDKNHTLWWFDQNGATQLTNSTGHNTTTTVTSPIDSCGLYDKVLDDGRPLASCVTTGAGNVRRNFPVNPNTKELLPEYTGSVPTGAVLRDVAYGTFGDTPYINQGVTRQGMYVDVSIGTFYFMGNDPKLRLTTNNFESNSVISTGDYQLLIRFPAR